jgi:hypothetical protein
MMAEELYTGRGRVDLIRARVLDLFFSFTRWRYAAVKIGMVRVRVI